MVRPIVNDPQVARRLSEAAYDVMSTQGLSAVTMRSVAARADCSATAIYSLFGGKDGLVGAALRTGAEGLHRALAAAADRDDPRGVQQLSRMASAYLGWAGEHPHVYQALFGGARTTTPTSDPGALGLQDPAAPLMAAIQQAIREGEMAGPPEVIATTLWAGLHGLATLNTSGALDPRAYRAAAPALTRSLLLGWSPRRDPRENSDG